MLPPPQRGVSDRLRLFLLLAVCAVIAWLRWAKLDELLWGDPVHWLHETSRVAAGELPYRDYSFQYPPFTAFFFGWMFRIFGATFQTASVLVNFWSFAVVLLCFALTRYLVPPTLRFASCFLLVAVGATSLTNFNLFSYRIYTPALETGAAGAMLSLLGMLRILRRYGSKGANAAMIAAGSAIALLSKPEFALATLCGLALFAFLNGEGWWNLKLMTVSILPAALLYAWLASAVGRQSLMDGISGYGLATFSCPWWPTGIGVFGVASAFGEGLFLCALLSFPWRRDFETALGAIYRKVRILAIPGLLIFLAYVALRNVEAITSSRTLLAKARLILPSFVWTVPVLLPVMWTSIAAFLFLLREAKRKRAGRTAELLLILVVPVSMSARTWFGSTQGVIPDISAACYPFLLILGPYFLWSFLSSASPRVPAVPIVAAIAIGYGLLRIVGGAALLADSGYRRLETAAGAVRISDYLPAIEIYRYVAEHTSPSDYVLDMPYGGGINFAAQRPNPIFDTMLFNMEIPERYQQRDLSAIAMHPPKLIVAPDSPRFGTNYSFGIEGNRACVCPRLVWVPDRPSYDPNYVYPLVDYIASHYRPVLRIGGKVILEPLH
ncbi:MAG: hypothetical protein LAO79_09825 [Acidobacteriia bacterium]|nr:hypothetical protein [Terriglobia bacterium]